MKMKKVLATMLALAMLSSGAVFAEGTDVEEVVSTIYYTVPFTTHEAGNRIGVNQEEIKAVLNVAVTDEILNSVTFKDKNGATPAGGIIVTKDESDETGKTISVKFGELLEGMEYTLTVDGETVKYKTAKKVLVKEDFDDWALGVPETVADSRSNTYRFANNNDLLLVDKGSTRGTYEIKANGSDRYMELNKNTTGDFILGTYVTDAGKTAAASINEAKIITEAKIAMSDITTEGNQMAGLWHWYFTANNNNGYPGVHDRLLFKDFETDSNGFYNIFVTTQKSGSVPNDIDAYITAENKGASGIIGTHSFDYIASDKISGNSYSIETKVIDNMKAYNSNVNSTTLFKAYPNNDAKKAVVIKVSDYNQGFYTMPETFGEGVYNKDLNTLTFTLNTDMDAESLDVTAVSDSGVAETEVTYNASSRQISVELLNPKAEI